MKKFNWMIPVFLPCMLQAQVKLLFHDYAPLKVSAVSSVEMKPKIKSTIDLNGTILPSETHDVEVKNSYRPGRKEVNEIGEVSKNVIQSPVPSFQFEPAVKQTIDPHIAVGRNYLIITNYDDIGFFDKSGKLLDPKTGGLKTHLNADIFFGSFFTPINELLQLNTKGPEYQINEFYDLRVIYDDNSRRFLIIAAARNQVWLKDPNTPDNLEPYAKRLVAFAVSKTEDPRDGFYQYMTTENNYRDWPRIAINGNHLLIANNSEDGFGSGPVAYIISMNDIMQGKHAPAAVSLSTADFGFDRVNVVTSFDAPFPFTCFLRSNGNQLNILYFDKNASLQNKPAIKKTTVDLPDDVGFLSNGAYIRNNNLYLVYHYVATERIPNQTPARLKIRYVRIPLSANNASLAASKGNGFLHWGFGRNSKDDDPADLVSYEEPAIAINKKGDFLIGYGRTGVTTKNIFYPEVRYTLYYANETEHRPSVLLHKGESLPTQVHKDENTATVYSQNDYLHYAAAAPDPSNNSFWMIHVYAGPNKGYRMIVGKINP